METQRAGLDTGSVSLIAVWLSRGLFDAVTHVCALNRCVSFHAAAASRCELST